MGKQKKKSVTCRFPVMDANAVHGRYSFLGAVHLAPAENFQLSSACHVKPITEHEPLPRPQRLSSIGFCVEFEFKHTEHKTTATTSQRIDDETASLRHVYLIYVQLKSLY